MAPIPQPRDLRRIDLGKYAVVLLLALALIVLLVAAQLTPPAFP